MHTFRMNTGSMLTCHWFSILKFSTGLHMLETQLILVSQPQKKTFDNSKECSKLQTREDLSLRFWILQSKQPESMVEFQIGETSKPVKKIKSYINLFQKDRKSTRLNS